MISGPWVRTWKQRMQVYAIDNDVDIPTGFIAKTIWWGPYAEMLAKRVKLKAGIRKPDGKLDGDLRKILRNVDVSTLKPPYTGIDVSNHQAFIDWNAVRGDAQNIKFAWAKCTEGATFVDRWYDNNKTGARKNKIKFGAYAWIKPGTVSYVVSQIDHLLDHIDYKKGDLAPAIDWEETAAASPAYVNALEAGVNRIHEKLGVWPVMYGGYYVLAPMRIPSNSVIKNCPLWLPAYGRNDGGRYESAIPGVPTPWKNFLNPLAKGWDVHQYTSNGRVSGIPGPVDMNYSIVRIEDLM